MPSDNSGFQYEPLGRNGFAIRVLRILPGREDEAVACTLERYVEATGDGWACLSYTWGTEPASREIRLNGSTFLVRPNLYQFLWQARQRKVKRPIWIDAVCINQSDPEERNFQVQLMGTIFQTANQVIAWLGQGSPRLEPALSKLAAGLDYNTTRVSVAVGSKVFANITPSECDALFELCSHAFWTRRWIIQELWLPELPVIWCGSASLTVPAFIAAMEALTDYPSVHNHALSSPELEAQFARHALTGERDAAEQCSYGNIGFSARSRQCSNMQALAVPKQAKQHGLNLPWLLNTFVRSDCADFHDYVYAFRGLLQQGDFLHVSYGLPSDQVLSQTLDFVTQTSHPRLIGASIAERNFLANLCKGLGVGRSGLEHLFCSRTTVFLVQVGQAIELGRKTVNAWRFADSITNPATFVNTPWRNTTRCAECWKLMEDNIALNELVLDDTEPDQRQVWLRGLESDASNDLSSLRAAYEPSILYNSAAKTRWLLKDFAYRGTSILALAFDPPEEHQDGVQPWLDSVLDHFVVTVADSDDAGLALPVSTVPQCESTECLLSRHS